MAVRHLRGSIVQLLLRQAGGVTSELQSLAPARMATAVAVAAPAKKAKTEYKHTREAFIDCYNQLRDELVNDELLAGQPKAAEEWLKEMLDYNVPGGKLNRGMAVYDVLAAIKGADNLSQDEIFKANALGWCIEWLQAFFLVADDIMDGSVTRRGQPCWYKVPKVGLIACNDYILLECCMFRILKAHFRGGPIYAELLELFHEVTYQTSHGQLLDLTTAPPPPPGAAANGDGGNGSAANGGTAVGGGGAANLGNYNLDTYMRIVTYKTAYYTFYLPVACGMLLGGLAGSAPAFSLAERLCVDIGRYFQIQDDYLDCYGDPAVIGKVGTDIEDAKCCWLVCTALQKADAAQLAVLRANYGRHDAGAVAAVKALYAELGIAAAYEAYEAETYARLSAEIEAQQLLPKAVFTSLLDKIYKRKK